MLMAQDLTTQEAMKRLEEHFGSREGILTHNLTILSTSGQPADITFYRRKPLINVQISTRIGAARLYGLESQLARLLRRIEFSNGRTAGLSEIWTVNPMPIKGFTPEELAAVDVSQGEERQGPQRETLRKMIRKTYHCASRKETDYYLRRWIAS
jgi:hypothetical protein